MDDVGAMGAEKDDQRSLGSGDISKGAKVSRHDIGEGEFGRLGARGKEIGEIGGECGHDRDGAWRLFGRQEGPSPEEALPGGCTILVTMGVCHG